MSFCSEPKGTAKKRNAMLEWEVAIIVVNHYQRLHCVLLEVRWHMNHLIETNEGFTVNNFSSRIRQLKPVFLLISKLQEHICEAQVHSLLAGFLNTAE